MLQVTENDGLMVIEMERNKSSVDSVNCNYINHMNPTVNRIGPLRTS